MWGNGSGCSTKMSDVSISLRSLTKNERQWAIHSGHSPKVSESLVLLSESLIWSLFHHLLAKNKQFTKKTEERIPNPGVHHTAESSSAVCIILTPRSVSLHGVWLLALFACVESDSWHCLPARSLTPRSVSQFWICQHFNVRYLAQSPTPLSVSLHEVRLCAG